MFSFLTLVSSLVSFAGIGKIFKGKTSQSPKDTAAGILAFAVGVFGIAFFNPIFYSFWASFFCAVAFAAVALGLVSYTFLNASTPKEIIYNVKAEILPKEEEKEKPKQISKTFDMETLHTTAVPMNVPQEKDRVPIYKE